MAPACSSSARRGGSAPRRTSIIFLSSRSPPRTVHAIARSTRSARFRPRRLRRGRASRASSRPRWVARQRSCPIPPSRRSRSGAIRADQVRVEDVREAGPVYVDHHMWRALTLDPILAAAGLSARTRVLTELMTRNRLVRPASEHARPDWIRRTALADLLDTDVSTLSDEALYRNLDRLPPHRAAIEQALAARGRTLFNLDDTLPLRPDVDVLRRRRRASSSSVRGAVTRSISCVAATGASRKIGRSAARTSSGSLTLSPNSRPGWLGAACGRRRRSRRPSAVSRRVGAR